MLLLKCRDIHNDIMESISEQLLPEDVEEKTKERLFNFVKDIHNQERTLIILDGLDELPKDSEHYVDKLLQRRIYHFVMFWLPLDKKGELMYGRTTVLTSF